MQQLTPASMWIYWIFLYFTTFSTTFFLTITTFKHCFFNEMSIKCTNNTNLCLLILWDVSENKDIYKDKMWKGIFQNKNTKSSLCEHDVTLRLWCLFYCIPVCSVVHFWWGFYHFFPYTHAWLTGRGIKMDSLAKICHLFSLSLTTC